MSEQQHEVHVTVRHKDRRNVPQLTRFKVVGTQEDVLPHVQRIAKSEGWSEVQVHDHSESGDMELHNEVMKERGQKPRYSAEAIAAARTRQQNAKEGKPDNPMVITDHRDAAQGSKPDAEPAKAANA